MTIQDTFSRRGLVQAGAGLLSLAATGGLLGACGDSGSGEPSGGGSDKGDRQVTFGFSHPFAEAPLVQTIKRQVKAIAEAEGWKVLLDETQSGNLQSQMSTMDSWITQKVTAINAFMGDPSAFEATARRATKAGIIWTTYALPTDAAAGGALFPPSLSGDVTGKATVEWINANDPDAEVLLLELPVGGEPKKRTSIPAQMIRRETQATIVASQAALDRAKALQVTEDVLQSHPNVTVVVGATDEAALGAAEAFRKHSKLDPSKVWIIGQDGQEDALAALASGSSFFRASAALDIRKLCEDVVGVTKRAIDREWKPGDQQEYTKLAPTLVRVDDKPLIDRFLATYR